MQQKTYAVLHKITFIVVTNRASAAHWHIVLNYLFLLAMQPGFLMETVTKTGIRLSSENGEIFNCLLLREPAVSL